MDILSLHDRTQSQIIIAFLFELIDAGLTLVDQIQYFNLKKNQRQNEFFTNFQFIDFR
jgi:hypothetical protein